MVNFLNKLELSNQKYRTNGDISNDSYNGGSLFLMKEFVSFGTYHWSMYFMSKRFLKDNIDGFCDPPFQLAYIRDTTYPSHKNLLGCVINLIICGG